MSIGGERDRVADGRSPGVPRRRGSKSACSSTPTRAQVRGVGTNWGPIAVELHTGRYADAPDHRADVVRELDRGLVDASARVRDGWVWPCMLATDLIIANVGPTWRSIGGMAELNIGHMRSSLGPSSSGFERGRPRDEGRPSGSRDPATRPHNGCIEGRSPLVNKGRIVARPNQSVRHHDYEVSYELSWGQGMGIEGSDVRGRCTVALVTPFKDGGVDYAGLRELGRLADRAVGRPILSPVGTTGESPTLSHDEHERVISTVVEQSAGRAKVHGRAPVRIRRPRRSA